MATPKDVQDLLRMLTSGRNKMPMMAAMGQMKVLQGAGFRSLSEIASGDLAALTKALGDEKAAKQLKSAAKKQTSADDKKRGASSGVDDVSLVPNAKRSRSAYELAAEPATQKEAQEAALALAEIRDEEEISRTTVYCNRAPLVLAFAVALLKYTMPEQPLSSRLSLAQAVVSLNSQSKAASIGISASATTAEMEGWGHGQPKVRIMSREVPVLKRGGYEFKAQEGQESKGSNEMGSEVENGDSNSDAAVNATHTITTDKKPDPVNDDPKWSVSQSVTSKGSTFIARSIAISSAAHARHLLKQLMASNPDLQNASHNVTAWRVPSERGGIIIEECDDDGEAGGGRHILSILKADNLSGVMLLLTRWYGGIMLGSQRWQLMSQTCRDSLSQRLRVPGTVGGGGGDKVALWGLDLEAMRSTNAPVAGGTAAGMPVHKPETARAYILRAFALGGESSDDSATTQAKKPKKKPNTGIALEREKAHNLALLLGALDLLFRSWAGHLSRDDLDRRAWGWYTATRPHVEPGVSGWGAKGPVRLSQILDLQRKG